MIYFIQQGGDGPIKIGLAEDPYVRCDLLQVGNPEKLYVRAVMPGGLAEEAALHMRFADGAIRGEWFASDTPGLLDLVAEAEHDEFWSEDELICERCQTNPVPLGRRKLCVPCGTRRR